MKGFQQYLAEGPRDPRLPFPYDPQFFYHITATKNLTGIRREGLTTGHKETFDSFKKDKDMVHLTPDADATEYWYGMIGSEKGAVSVLRVSCTSIGVVKSFRPDEVLTAEVPAEKLEVFRDGRWQHL